MAKGAGGNGFGVLVLALFFGGSVAALGIKDLSRRGMLQQAHRYLPWGQSSVANASGHQEKRPQVSVRPAKAYKVPGGELLEEMRGQNPIERSALGPQKQNPTAEVKRVDALSQKDRRELESLIDIVAE
jgi:hypothetical protein